MSKRRLDQEGDTESKRHRGHGSSESSFLPQLYDIFSGEVASIQDYGVFVRIPDCDKQGLVHKSQMTVGRITHPSEMADVKDRVWCKVISIDPEGGKIGLSMKLVNQGTGKDLDENHVQLQLDEQKRRQGPDNKFEKIVLEAEYNTICKKCSEKGHLAKDCYQIQGKSYGLVPELDDLVNEELDKHKAEKKPKKAKKEKKEKKDKKHKHKSKKKKDHR